MATTKKTKKVRPWRVQVVAEGSNYEYQPAIDSYKWVSRYWWRLRAPNGEIVAGAEQYTTKAKARKTAKKVWELMDPECVIFEEVEE